MAPTATLDVADGVAVITLANPPVNALHPDGEEIVLFFVLAFMASFDGGAATHTTCVHKLPRSRLWGGAGGRGRRPRGPDTHPKTAAHCHAPAQRGFKPAPPPLPWAFSSPHSAPGGRVRLSHTLCGCRSGRRGQRAR